MPSDDDKSLGDDATFQGSVKQPPNEEQSLGDRSTFHGGDASSLSDLQGFTGVTDPDMEIVDLSGRYKIEETLGQGGMGEVLLATDTRLDRKVAIKRIRGDAGASKAAVARFLTEAKSVAALNHPNVVHVYDYGRDESGPFLIMEYVAGGSLLDRCKQGPMELEEAVELACQLCDGLGRAHDAGIVHRDIKPANILLTADGIPKLTDFGLAKADSRDHTMTMAGAVLGTLDFMPPEQRQNASLVDARSDLWSLAATLYQMVTGESPKVIRLNKVPATLQNLLDKALEESKGSRYQTASELKDALTQSQHGGPETTVSLEQGVCPSCGTSNEANRKFCRNTSCAASLQVKCLSCSATIPVWEGVCGECGSIQTDLLEQRREEMATAKAEAETCLASHDYKRACELATEIGNEADPRLQHLKSWSDEFPEQVESIKRAQIANAKQAIAEALSHEQAHDYSSGIKAFAQIPDSIIAGQDLAEMETARDVLARLQEKHSIAETLENEIKSRIKARNLSGLLSEVQSLLELLPERDDLLKLKTQLIVREKKQRDNYHKRAEELKERGVIDLKFSDRCLAIREQYERRKNQPSQQQRQEAKQINETILAVAGQIEELTQLASRRLESLPALELQKDQLTDLNEPNPDTLAATLDRLACLKKDCEKLKHELQSGAASKIVDGFYLPGGVAIFIAIWAIVAFFVAPRPPWLWMAAGIIPGFAFGFGMHLLLQFPLRHMTRRIYPRVVLLGRLADKFANHARGLSKKIAETASAELLEKRDSDLAAAERWKEEQMAELQKRLARASES